MLAKNNVTPDNISMSDVQPQFSLSPEGELSFNFDQNAQSRREAPRKTVESKIDESLAVLEEQKATIKEDGGLLRVRIDAQDLYRTPEKTSIVAGNQSESLGKSLAAISRLAEIFRADRDQIIRLEYITDRGASFTVGRSFQQWIESGKNEDPSLAREVAKALATPIDGSFVKNVIDMTEDQFKEYSFQRYELRFYPGEYELYSTEKTEKFYVEKTAVVEWRWTNLTTLGDCACLGSAAHDRRILVSRMPPEVLYGLLPHNIDYSPQALSLLLGMGSLAYNAAKEPSDTDIIGDIERSEKKIPIEWFRDN